MNQSIIGTTPLVLLEMALLQQLGMKNICIHGRSTMEN